MAIDRREVAITGIGVVSPAGNDVPTFWQRLLEGRTAIGPIANIPTERLKCKIAAEVGDFGADTLIERRRLSTMDRIARLAVVAARHAIDDSGLDLAAEDDHEIPIVLGTGVGGLNTLDDSFRALYGENASRLHPLTIPRLMFNAAASHISMELGIGGETFAVASACASGTHAIGQAYKMVRSGYADVAISGGAEACITVGTMKGWEALRVLSDDGCRPFCSTRNGLVIGEGACIVTLEELGRARARGATIYAIIDGYGASADAADLTSPDVVGASRAITRALADAARDPAEIGHVNAHGTGTKLNDQTEAQAIHRAFGDHARDILVTSCKGVLGHSLGAAGAFEAAATALTLRAGLVPPTAGVRELESGLDIDVVIGAPREFAGKLACSNSFAFGGLNASLVLRAAD